MSNKRIISPNAPEMPQKRINNQENTSILHQKTSEPSKLKNLTKNLDVVTSNDFQKWQKITKTTPGPVSHVTFAKMVTGKTTQPIYNKLKIHECDVMLRFSPRKTREEVSDLLLNNLPYKATQYESIFCKYSGLCAITMTTPILAKQLVAVLKEKYLKKIWPDLTYARKWIEDDIPLIFSHVPSKFPDDIIISKINSLNLQVTRQIHLKDKNGIKNGKRYYFVNEEKLKETKVPSNLIYDNHYFPVYHPGQEKESSPEKPQEQSKEPEEENITERSKDEETNKTKQKQQKKRPQAPDNTTSSKKTTPIKTKSIFSPDTPTKRKNTKSPDVPPRRSTPTSTNTGLDRSLEPLVIDEQPYPDQEGNLNSTTNNSFFIDETLDEMDSDGDVGNQNYTFPSTGYTYDLK